MLGDEILKQRIGLHLSISELAHLTNTNDDIIIRLETHERKFISEENFNKLNTILHLEEHREYIYRNTNDILGNMLKQARLQKGYTQREVAYLAGYAGSSKISQMEHGTYSKIAEETFLKLQDVLALNRDEFEPFIEKNHKIRGSIKNINQKEIQKLITEKRDYLLLSKEELGKLASLSQKTIHNIENKEHYAFLSTLIKLMYELEFSKEEILMCIPDLKEEDLKYFKPKEKVKKKPIL